MYMIKKIIDPSNSRIYSFDSTPFLVPYNIYGKEYMIGFIIKCVDLSHHH